MDRHTELRTSYNEACEAHTSAIDAYEALPADAEEATVTTARDAVTEAREQAEARKTALENFEADQRAREQFKPVAIEPGEPRIESVNEPDMYVKNGKNLFLRDLYMAQIRHDGAAAARIQRHQEHELAKMTEERAISTSTLGNIIPPVYLVDMYAKASRNGRVFADQVSHAQELPPEGMSIIIPRLTTGTSAAAQSSEGATVSTQDVVETDDTVPVVTVAGYNPVSRQTLERASYSEPIIFEDLIARYHSAVDTNCLTGQGSSGQALGVFHTSDVVAISANSDGTAPKLWNCLANAQQQILSKWGGLGLVPDKVFMHPRRWGAITAYLDSDNRPLFGYNNAPIVTTGTIGTGEENYGYVGNLQGLKVYVDSNIPTNLDTNTNRDAIVVTCSSVVHLCERPDDPITLAFEQRQGNALSVDLIAYGYIAFTAGRYPDATAIIDDFPAPTF